VPEFDFVLAPCWADPPYYRLTIPGPSGDHIPGAVDQALRQQNEEYDSRRKSLRLGPLQTRSVSPEAIRAMDQRLSLARHGTAEQYKRPCLFIAPGEDDRALGLSPSST
jgi:hypothetical protein